MRLIIAVIQGGDEQSPVRISAKMVDRIDSVSAVITPEQFGAIVDEVAPRSITPIGPALQKLRAIAQEGI